MPTSVGPNTFGEENLVFGYDLGDVANSYKGEPAGNLITSGIPGYFGSGGQTLYQSSLYGLKSDSGIFQRNYVTNPALADSGTYSNNGGLYKNFTTSALNAATRYIQISFDFYMITRYRTYGSSTVGLNGYLGITNTDSTSDTYGWDTRYCNGSGDDWSNDEAYVGRWQKVSLIAALRGDKNPASINAMYIYYDRFTQGEGIFTNFIITETPTLPTGPVRYTAGTRSATQGLIDLKGSSTIDLSNVSFDSNAQMTFDGTDDKIHGISTVLSYLSSSAFEFVVTPESTGERMMIGGYRHNDGYSSPTIGAVYIDTDNKFKASVITTAEVYRYAESTTTTSANQTYHIVFNKDTVTGVMQLYINGTLESTTTFNAATYGQWSSAGSYIGSNTLDFGKSFNTNSGQGWSGDFLDGKIHSIKLYSRTLTASEITSNFNAIKSRFGI